MRSKLADQRKNNMATKNTKKEKFVPSTDVLTAEITVVRKMPDGEEKGSLSAKLDLKEKELTFDLSRYRTMPIENARLLGEALVALAKEAQDAIEVL